MVHKVVNDEEALNVTLPMQFESTGTKTSSA